MSLPAALSLLALTVSAFAVLAVGAVYGRLRTLEHTALAPDGARLSDTVRQAPDSLRPGRGQTATLVVLLDSGCPVCGRLWTAAVAAERADVRVLGLVAGDEAARAFEGGTVLADDRLWTELYEGYAPCVYLVAPEGSVTRRHFVYGDTDVPALLDSLLAAPSVTVPAQGGERAS